MPDGLTAIPDAERGAKLSGFVAKGVWDMDAPGRKIAEKAGNTITMLNEAVIDALET